MSVNKSTLTASIDNGLKSKLDIKKNEGLNVSLWIENLIRENLPFVNIKAQKIPLEAMVRKKKKKT